MIYQMAYRFLLHPEDVQHHVLYSRVLTHYTQDEALEEFLAVCRHLSGCLDSAELRELQDARYTASCYTVVATYPYLGDYIL